VGGFVEFYNDPIKVDKYEDMCVGYDGTELYQVLDKHLENGSRLLELGCGPGNDLDYFNEKYKVTGSDLSDEFLLRCKKRFPDMSFIKQDAISINTDQKFDCVFSNKVLHHLNTKKLEASLKRQQAVIKPNGIFAHTFWIGDKEFMMEDMLFVFHNRENLLKLIAKYFSILEVYAYKELEEGDSIFVLAANDHAT